MVKCTDGHSYDWNDFAKECDEIKTKAKHSQCVLMNQGWYSLQDLEKIIEKLKAKKDG